MPARRGYEHFVRVHITSPHAPRSTPTPRPRLVCGATRLEVNLAMHKLRAVEDRLLYVMESMHPSRPHAFKQNIHGTTDRKHCVKTDGRP